MIRIDWISNAASLLIISMLAVNSNASSVGLMAYGNANLDDVIDEADCDYVKSVIAGDETPTLLADSNRDGIIDEKDVAQIEAMIGGDENEITIIDSLNRTITIKTPVERVIVTEDKLGEQLQIIGADDNVVGIDPNIAELKGLFPTMSNKAAVGNCKDGELDYEIIAELDPDLVLIHGDYGACNVCIEPLEKLGIPVIALDTFIGSGSNLDYSIDKDEIDLYSDSQAKSIRLLGEIFDRQDRAREFLTWRNDILNEIMSRSDGLDDNEIERASVLLVFRGRDYMSIGEGRKEIPSIVMAGLNNIDEVSGTHIIDPEAIASQNPEIVILTGYSDYTGDYTTETTTSFEEIVNSVENMPEFSCTDAVKDGQIYVISGECMDIRPWIGAAYIGKVAYPDRFEDINPEDIAREYFEEWLGVPYKGIFFYPMPWEI